MADVPSWLLVFSTLTAGGFGLAPQFIVPRRDREQRELDERIAARKLLLEKTEKLFEQLDIAAGWLSSALISENRRIQAEGDHSLINSELLEVMGRVSALVFTYFPSLTPIFDQTRTSLQVRLSDWSETVSKGAGDVAATKKITNDIIIIQTGCVSAIRMELNRVANLHAPKP